MRRKAILVTLCAGSLFFFTLATRSLAWRSQHDGPLMSYIAWMIEVHRAVPYRDLVDMNMAGTYFVNYLIGHPSGYSDLGMRIGDLAWLAGVLAATFLAMKPFGTRVAGAAALLFGLAYLGFGPWMSLQREFLMLLPLSLALAVVSRPAARGGLLPALLAGLFFGLAATVKPQVLIGFPLVLALPVHDAWITPGPPGRARRAMGVLLAALAGVGLPVAVLVTYLVRSGAWPFMLELYTRYAPVYASVNGLHRTMLGSEKWPYLLNGMLAFGHQRIWLVPAVVGAALVLTARRVEPRRKRMAALLVGLAAAYSLYVGLQGRFFDYHWLIAFYFTLLLSSLCLFERSEIPEDSERLAWLAPALLVAVAVTSLPLNGGVKFQLAGGALPPPKSGRPDQIAAILKERLRPGDLVQPLDITGGAVHAMLLSRARIATPFMYDSFFYIRVSNPYVQELRRRFLAQFEAAKPRFVVDVYGPDKPWVQGVDTSRDFPELRGLLARDYVPIAEGLGTAIYERRTLPAP